MHKFSEALAATGDEVLTKIARIPHGGYQGLTRDPLDTPGAGPEGVKNRAPLMRTIGGLTGALAGGALGAGLGQDVGDWTDVPGADWAGSAGGLATGGLGGGLAGMAAGHALGRAMHPVENVLNPYRRGVDKLRNMSPEHGFAMVRAAKRQGDLHPDEIKGMEDAYNARRLGMQDQLATGLR
jgi:hypothetical protein